MSAPDVMYADYLVSPYTQKRVELYKYRGDITAFLVQLEYNYRTRFGQPDDWRQVARFDHHPSMSWGHDIRREGLHMDIYKNGAKEKVIRQFPSVPVNKAPAFCERFFVQNHDRLVDQFERWHGLTANGYSSSP